MKKQLVFILATAVIFSSSICNLSAATYIPSFDVSAQSVYMMNLDSNMVIYEKDKDVPTHPGGLAQMMTVILALESGLDLESNITLKSYIEGDMYTKGKEFGRIQLCGLLKGETISLKNLLYAVMIQGANEACAMVADYIGDGSLDYFVELMNKRAKELGAVNTKFLSPHGLLDESFTTAYDMYVIAKHAMTLPLFSEIANTKSYNGGPTNKHDNLNWNAINKMIVPGSSTYYSNLKGIKTSNIRSIGTSSISLAQKNGYSYMMVVLNCPTTNSIGEALEENMSFTTTKNLYDWGFETFKVKTLLEQGKSFGEVPVKLSLSKDFTRLMAEKNFTALIPDDIEPSSIVYETKLPKYLKAPVERGEQVGYVDLILAGEKIGTVMLVSADTVEATSFLVVVDELQITLRSYWFKFGVVFVFVSLVMYIGLIIMRNRKFRRRTTKRHR